MKTCNVKRTLTAAFLAIVTACSAPANAATGYFIVDGMRVIAGPYDNYFSCTRMLRVYDQPGGPMLQCESRIY